jgi:hypothetical protein
VIATTLECMDLELVRLRRMVARAAGSAAAILIAGTVASPALATTAAPAQISKADPAADIYAPWIVPGASGSAGGQSPGSGGLAGAGQVLGPGGDLIPVSVIFAARELPATVSNHGLPTRIRQLPGTAEGRTASSLPPVSNLAASPYLSNTSDAGAGVNWLLLAMAAVGLGFVLRPRGRRS